DSNGLELAARPNLACDLASAGLSGIYLQFDSLSDDVYRALRGRNLLDIKRKAIENCRRAGLAVTLAPTIVKGLNDHELWDIVAFGVREELVGVNFQPFTPSGRYPRALFHPIRKVTTADVVNGLVHQSGGKLLPEDFVPIPCPDPRCSVLSYTLLSQGIITPLNRLVDVEGLLDYYYRLAGYDEILDGVREQLYELWSCSAVPGKIQLSTVTSCCPGAPIQADGFFSIGCHGLQDLWNFDTARVRRCCFQALTPEAKLVPFCLYNLGNGSSIPSCRR
ncbi:MAG: hypothetical protein M1358_09775, partial [Chloroflexi bacterium]|nr:hypothetical protein [Chloroflexota bacterium]